MKEKKRFAQKAPLSEFLIAVMCICIAWMFAAATTLAAPARHVEGVSSEGGECHSRVMDLIDSDELPCDGPVGVPDGSAKAPDADPESETDSYIPLVLITIGFDEQPYNDEYDWHEAAFGEGKTLKQYYRDMSLGKFTFQPVKESSAYGVDGNTNKADRENDGIIHITFDRKKTYGWELYTYVHFASSREMIPFLYDAVMEAGKYMDFSAYDSNGDGTIQNSELAVGFIAAGCDIAYIGGSCPKSEQYRYIWPVSSSFSWYDSVVSDLPGVPAPNGIKVDEYILMAENQEDSNVEKQSGLGVMTHELGHYLGLPDLYPIRMYPSIWEDYSVGDLSIMDNGCYGTDLNGKITTYSFDIWSRVKLGWVTPKTIGIDTAGDELKIAGSYCEDAEDPIAYKIETGRENEYYLVENRRFSGWDEGMSRLYKDFASSGEDSEDLGGGLIFWHIDDEIYEKYVEDNDVNGWNHRPAVMPLFWEEDGDGYSLIGSAPVYRRPFFDAESWGQNMFLPLYGQTESDSPSDRTQDMEISISLDSESLPVMEFHMHEFLYDRVDWADDYSSATYGFISGCCWDYIPFEVTTDITSEVIVKPSSTEPGLMEYTAHFKTDNFEETEEVEIPPLDEAAVTARNEALHALADKIIAAKKDLAGNYTEESLQALKDAIDAANALYDDDTTTVEDVKAADAELTMAWRLLEVADTTPAADEQAWREAVCDLAKLLAEIYKGIDPTLYKPADYAAFMGVCDEACAVLDNADSATEDLQNAKMKLSLAWKDLEKNGKRISIETATVEDLPAVVYDKKAHTPEPVVVLDEKTLAAETEYTIQYSDNTKAGTATVTITGTGDYTGTVTKTFVIEKAENPLTVKGKTATVKYTALKKKAQTVTAAKAYSVTKKGEGKVTYKLAGVTKSKFKKYFAVSTKTGKITVKKGLKKGTYKVKVKVKAAGNANYKASKEKTVTVTVKVK